MTDAPAKPERIWANLDHWSAMGTAADGYTEYVRADLAATLPAPVEALVEALAEIRDRHVPDQPMSDGADEADYVRRQYSELRRIAHAALAAYEGHRT